VTWSGGRWKTRRGLEGLHGVSSRLGRIDTLNCRDERSDTERCTSFQRKQTRGGRKPDDRAGTPRRGKGQESIGLVRG